MNLREDPNFYRNTLEIPNFRVNDWVRYLHSFLEVVPADSVGEALNITKPDFVTALAYFQQQGMPVERICGIIQGLSLIQMLHYHGYINVGLPPIHESLPDL